MKDLPTLLKDIATAIRMKTGDNEKINAQDFPQKIREIETGGENNSNYDLKEQIKGVKQVLLITEGKLLKSVFSPISSSLALRYNIYNISPEYVVYEGINGYWEGQEETELVFTLWKNCRLSSVKVFCNDKEISANNYTIKEVLQEETDNYFIYNVYVTINPSIQLGHYKIEILVSYDEGITPTYPLKKKYLDYASSDKNAYIDTEIIMKNGYSVEIEFQYLTQTNNTWFYGTPSFEAGYFMNSLYTGGGFSYMTSKNGTLAKGICSSNQSYTSYLFARQYSSVSENRPSHIKIYSCKTYNENGELIQELLPVISYEEGHEDEIAMYDTISQKFFYNIGTESFSGGYDE